MLDHFFQNDRGKSNSRRKNAVAVSEEKGARTCPYTV